MKKNTVFEYSSYKSYLRSQFSGRENRGQMSRAADYLNCGKPYLSRVLSEKMDITQDQGFRLAVFWELNASESEYFVLLVDLARATTSEFKSHLQGKLKSLKSEFETQQKKGQSILETAGDSQTSYYTNWLLIPLHLATSFKHGISVDEAKNLFRQSAASIEEGLKYLKDLGWITEKNRRYYFAKGDKHLDAKHPLVGILHRNVRDLAILNMHGKSNSVHVSYWYSMSQQDFLRLRDKVLAFLEQVNRVAEPSASEKVVGCAVDFFSPWE